jgi:hypothetical protein
MKKTFFILAAFAFLSGNIYAASIEAQCTITLSSDKGGADAVTLFQHPDHTDAIVNGYDITHATNTGNDNNVNIYAFLSGKNLSQVVTNDLTNLPIVIETNKLATNYTLTFSNVAGLPLYIYDAVEDVETLIADGSAYSFTAAVETTLGSRFRIGRKPVPTEYSICYQYGAFEIANPDAAARAINIYALGADGQPDTTAPALYTGSAEAAAVTTISAADLAAAGLVADTQYAIVVGAESALIFRVK